MVVAFHLVQMPVTLVPPIKGGCDWRVSASHTTLDHAPVDASSGSNAHLNDATRALRAVWADNRIGFEVGQTKAPASHSGSKETVKGEEDED
jgi:hypothetical protein